MGESAAAVAAALEPYAWREFTDRMLARRAVGAMDRHAVVALLADLPGTEIGDSDALEPADARDDRVDVLVDVLEGQQWRARSLIRLCMDLAATMAGWHDARDATGDDLRRLDEV